MTTPLISVAYFKEFLPIRPGNNTFDDKLLSITKAVTERFEQACNRTFLKEARTEYHNSRNTRTVGYDFAGDGDSGIISSNKEQTIMLRASPVDANVDIEVFYDPNRVWGADTKLAATDYFLDEETGALIINYPMSTCTKSIKIVYTAGYAENEGSLEDAIPEDLKVACVTQCIAVWTNTNPENVAINTDETDGAGGGSFKVKGGLLPDVAQALVRFKRVITGNG